MADDKGGGGLGGWAFGVVEAAKDAVGDVVTELESFTKFQQRVDQLIKDLRESPAGPKKVGHEPLGRTKFGGGHKGWHEADSMFTQYDTVIADLENLSSLLSDSIEAMGIAVLASHKGYDNVDDDVRRRLAAINAETTDHYGGEYVPEKEKQAADPGGSGKAEKQRGGDSGGSM
ncbi:MULTISPECIES: hypothetical protein [Streptomyces]|uniref:hypothetical protein n=1 Tax=Streptomyces TaxID=1883 RepID=UPI0021090317|nr:hypothetical protein [Streptomyces longispororuber]MCQ4210995.1 hypothetical protein [Streptomyces longispororuber]